MTTLKLDTLSPRIQAHKMALVHIVKPPVCTERPCTIPKPISSTWINRSWYAARWRWLITWRNARSGLSTMN